MAAKQVRKVVATEALPISDQIPIIRTEMVPVDELHLYYKNPNVGNVPAIAISLAENGQFKPIVVNIGTKTGRPNEILAGNHTYLGARKDMYYDSVDDDGKPVSKHKPAWTHIYVAFVDVDEDAAAAIVIADNKTAELAQRNEQMVADLMARLPERKLVATGHQLDEARDMVARAAGMREAALKQAQAIREQQQATDERIHQAMLDRDTDPDIDDEPRSMTTLPRKAVPELEDEEVITDEMTQVQALLELTEERIENEPWPSTDQWGIPMLRRDMLVEEVDEGITTWAGHEATPDDGSRWYLYQYGLGGMKGLPLDRSILCFYTHDHRFETWWENPAYNTARLFVKGLRQAVCPDFSFYYVWPRVQHLYGVYKSQWIGRFLQDAGISVIPRIQFADEESLTFNTLGIPKNPPVLAISAQNGYVPDGTKQENEDLCTKVIQKAIDKVRPENQVLIYGGPSAERVMHRLDLHGARGLFVLNYAGVRRGTVFDKKEGKASLTAAQKKKLRAKVRAEQGVPEAPARPDPDEDEDE